MKPCVALAGPDDGPQVAKLVGALLQEISVSAGAPQFEVEQDSLARQARDFLASGHYAALLARSSAEASPVGVLTMYCGGSLYAGGYFGVIAEFYVASKFRGQGIGQRLLHAAQDLSRKRHWQRIEVTTPPLPQYERTQRFYERHGFSVTGGRKLRWLCEAC